MNESKTTRTVTYRKPDGSYATCPVSKIPFNPIVQASLDTNLLPRIKKVYEMIKDVLIETADIRTLEQFEISFMRAFDPEEALEIQEIVVMAYRNCIAIFKTDGPKDFVKIYRDIMRHVVNWYTEKEKEMPYVKRIINTYEDCKKIYYKDKDKKKKLN